MNFHPTKLSRISPTTAAKLRACPLRAAFDTDPDLRSTTITGPAARLGIVCHHILEAIGQGAIPVDADWDQAFSTLWEREIAAQERSVAETPHDRHLGRARFWPQYGIRRARVKRLAFHSWNARRGRPGFAREENARTFTERRYVAFDGKMVGIVDVVRAEGGEVIIEDYKTGAITEVDEATGTTVPRDDYIQQVLLYAAMHHDTTGQWPLRGRLIPLEGDPIDIHIDPEQASRAADDVLDALKAYNESVDQWTAPEELARPASGTCLQCHYKGMCDAIWCHVDDTWAWRRHAVEGIIIEAEQRLGGTIVVEIQVERGSVPPGRYILHASNASQCLQILAHLHGRLTRITELDLNGGKLIATAISTACSVSRPPDALA